MSSIASVADQLASAEAALLEIEAREGDGKDGQVLSVANPSSSVRSRYITFTNANLEFDLHSGYGSSSDAQAVVGPGGMPGLEREGEHSSVALAAIASASAAYAGLLASFLFEATRSAIIFQSRLQPFLKQNRQPVCLVPQ